jgi:hypothetical protein
VAAVGPGALPAMVGRPESVRGRCGALKFLRALHDSRSAVRAARAFAACDRQPPGGLARSRPGRRGMAKLFDKRASGVGVGVTRERGYARSVTLRIKHCFYARLPRMSSGGGVPA